MLGLLLERVEYQCRDWTMTDRQTGFQLQVRLQVADGQKYKQFRTKYHPHRRWFLFAIPRRSNLILRRQLDPRISLQLPLKRKVFEALRIYHISHVTCF